MAESPFYRFYRRVKFPLPFKTWCKLPRLLTHKNEYSDGHVHLSPRPKGCDIFLKLDEWSGPPEVGEVSKNPDRFTIRPLRDEDWSDMPGLFLSAFGSQQPLASWDGGAPRRAARCIVDWTRLGRDGPLMRRACFAALTSPDRRSDGPYDRLCGAAIVVLVPNGAMWGTPEDAGVPHPEDPERRLVPHLDWVMVDRWMQRHGIGTWLLDEVARALRADGHRYLASTCTFDNTGSISWHWRNGFVLPPCRALPLRARGVDLPG